MKKPAVEVFANFLSSHWMSHKEIETNPTGERGRVLVAESESVPREVFIEYERMRDRMFKRFDWRDCIFADCYYVGGCPSPSGVTEACG